MPAYSSLIMAAAERRVQELLEPPHQMDCAPHSEALRNRSSSPYFSAPNNLFKLPRHPSNTINNIQLKQFPDAKVVSTHDSVWSDVTDVDETDEGLPEDALAQRLPQELNIVQENGAVYLEPGKKDSESATEPENAGWY